MRLFFFSMDFLYPSGCDTMSNRNILRTPESKFTTNAYSPSSVDEEEDFFEEDEDSQQMSSKRKKTKELYSKWYCT